MKWRFPWVRPNQRIVPTDFRRLAASVEDLIGNIAKHIFEDDTAAAGGGYGAQGVVLWGLSVSDATAGGVAKARVAPGAALLPSSAGDRGWRLAYMSSSQTVSLAAAQAGSPRTDTIQLSLIAEPEAGASSGGGLEETENRDFRSLNAENQEQIASQQTPTLRAPGGVASVSEGSTDASAGSVRLANVVVTVAAVTAVTDNRQGMFPEPIGSSILRGAGTAYRAIRARVAALSVQVDTVVSVGGGMLGSAQAASGGPTFGPADYTPILNGATEDVWKFGARDLLVDATVRTGGVRPIPAWFETLDATPYDIADAHYENDADGLRINAALVTRAIVSVRHYSAAGGVPSHLEQIGQNVTLVSRSGVGVYVVTFAGAAFGVTRGDWWSDRWIVRHYAGVSHSDTPALSWPIAAATAVVRDAEAGGTAYRLTVNVFVPSTAVPVDAPFVVELLGPLGAAIYDAGNNEPGAASDSWASVND